MDQVILHKRTKNLSPIRRSDDAIDSFRGKSSEMKTIKSITKFDTSKEKAKDKKKEKVKSIDNTKDKLQTPSALPTEQQEKEKEKEKDKNQNKDSSNGNKSSTSAIRNLKNRNDYRHFLCGKYHLIEADLNWILDLRNYHEKINYVKMGPTTCPPKFYDEDIAQFMNRIDEDKKRNVYSAKGNMNDINHLGRDRLGATANWSQYSFETTLRTTRPLFRVFKHNEPWKNLPYSQKKVEGTFLPPALPKDIEHFNKMDNYTIRPYNTVYEDYAVGKDIIKRKLFIANKTETLGFFGEHYSAKKYNDDYNEKNINEIRHILAYHTNSQSRFELGLRNYASQTQTQTQTQSQTHTENEKPEKKKRPFTQGQMKTDTKAEIKSI